MTSTTTRAATAWKTCARPSTEARLQGIPPFCLTIDRQAAGYLPAVFGARQYALLARPELLPGVLLDWLRQLVSR